ncbi:carbamoyl phosphate synthase small subunit [Putridiphycobacter roseus]|uniref:Carbamoyl phosphate synthase small chain n=1 Tax=Putridiphycobacter roseus TaxID=2219161 RepID=A0A2W1NFU6_9FLAO|nr:glutamine-hydrolyzing carbamoyl-phosphate synthase small subunit [Putridiphycobacter roseus]PZE18365.1 carbamoyl phosphate synthase small subunit [Putridiphycobacter roseus]
MSNIPAILLLKDGTVFKGNSIGKVGTTTGEIAFNTGMTGYQEVFSDPSYVGQILTMASPHIGNYGVHPDEKESSSMKIAGLITKKFSKIYSRDAANDSLQNEMLKDNVVGISDIDTRALVRIIRDRGAQNCIISSEEFDIEKLKAILDKVPSMDGLELSSKVSTKEAYTVGDENALFKVALLDIGVKSSIISNLVDRGCFVKVFPMDTNLKTMQEFNPNGIMLSNGPGDPSAMTNVIENVKEMTESGLPIFGICLGHQVLALGQGLKTIKMHNGHRGINHPVKNLKTGKGEITTQNHGFVVSMESIEENPNIDLTHIHLNDETAAGIEFKDRKIFSVQYHPEASAGPHDSRYLFDQFIANMKS